MTCSIDDRTLSGVLSSWDILTKYEFLFFSREITLLSSSVFFTISSLSFFVLSSTMLFKIFILSSLTYIIIPIPKRIVMKYIHIATLLFQNTGFISNLKLFTSLKTPSLFLALTSRTYLLALKLESVISFVSIGIHSSLSPLSL